MSEQEIYREAIRRWGPNAQTSKAAEELCELAAALNRYLSQIYAHEGEADYDELGRLLEAIAEEMADAEIMLQQLRMIFGGPKVNAWKAHKIRRLAERLGIDPEKE